MSNNWIEVGTINDIPAMGSRVIESEEGAIALFRNSEDKVFALRNKCPHKGGPLSDGLVAGRQVTCPLHSWTLELESGEAVAPDKGCARVFPVKVENQQVFLDFSSSIQE